jgi:hypothetical protein
VMTGVYACVCATVVTLACVVTGAATCDPPAAVPPDVTIGGPVITGAAAPNKEKLQPHWILMTFPLPTLNPKLKAEICVTLVVAELLDVLLEVADWELLALTLLLCDTGWLIEVFVVGLAVVVADWVFEVVCVGVRLPLVLVAVLPAAPPVPEPPAPLPVPPWPAPAPPAALPPPPAVTVAKAVPVPEKRARVRVEVATAPATYRAFLVCRWCLDI